MLRQSRDTFKLLACLGSLVLAGCGEPAAPTVDLLACGAECWTVPEADQSNWTIAQGAISGTTRVLDGAKSDPDASIFAVSRQVFGGDLAVDMEVTFTAGRYLGVYLDFDQATQTGIWMATGHALADDAPDNEVERAYVKTVDDSVWVVRATGELVVERGVPVRLRFTRTGDYYAVWNDDVLIATYRKPGGYPAGPLQLRLVNASAFIGKLTVTYDQEAT